jgi:hypothetical protein
MKALVAHLFFEEREVRRAHMLCDLHNLTALIMVIDMLLSGKLLKLWVAAGWMSVAATDSCVKASSHTMER